MGMIVHELATNAVKYGALCDQEGRVEIARNWAEAEETLLTLTWREVDGPPVKPPQNQGFGSKLITRLAAGQLHGDCHVSYDAGGAVWRIAFAPQLRPHPDKALAEAHGAGKSFQIESFSPQR